MMVVRLDWRHRSHWSPKRGRCRYCDALTSIRDGVGRPAHKVCAERAVAVWESAPTETCPDCAAPMDGPYYIDRCGYPPHWNRSEVA